MHFKQSIIIDIKIKVDFYKQDKCLESSRHMTHIKGMQKTTVSAGSIQAIFTGWHFSKPIERVSAIEATIHDGISIEHFNGLKDRLGISKTALASSMGLNERTLTRRKERLDSAESERLLRIMEIFNYAIEVLSDEESAKEWMTTPNSMFGNRTPLSLCQTEFGAAEVRNVLGRVMEVVYS